MITRLVRYSIKNTLRNKFLTVSSILVLTLLMFFINILTLLEDVSSKIIDSVNSKMTISLYLKEEYTNESLEVFDLIDDINKLKADIKIEYKDKEKLLEEMKEKEPNLVKILEKNNPLPNTIVISNVKISDYEKLNQAIESKMFVLSSNEKDKDYFANYSTQYKKINQVTFVLNLLKKGLYIIVFIFFVAIAIINYSVISNFIYYYKDEIYITKLVWWANSFIYWPFVIQWILYWIIAFLLNIFIFSFFIKNLQILFWDYYEFWVSSYILFLELLIFVLIWAISWYVSSKKYLKKTI